MTEIPPAGGAPSSQDRFAYRIDQLVHRYNGRTVLDIDRLTVARESITGLIGPNGSGKSTLLRLMAFVEPPAAGTIRFEGVSTHPFDEVIRRRGITLLAQEPYLLRRSVADNIAYGLKLRGRHAHRRTIADALDWVGLAYDEFAGRRWDELSGGEAQRVALAARLVLKPRVLLMDEPTASVDADSAQLIRAAAIRARDEWATALVIASHDWQWLYDVADTVHHLYRGRLFTAGMITVIHGPWQRADGDRFERVLADGQRLVVPPPPDGDPSAVLPVSAVSLEPVAAEPPAGRHYLDGLLTRLFYDHSTRRTLATVSVAGQTFTAVVSPTADASGVVRPGQPARISYHPNHVEWA